MIASSVVASTFGPLVTAALTPAILLAVRHISHPRGAGLVTLAEAGRTLDAPRALLKALAPLRCATNVVDVTNLKPFTNTLLTSKM